MSYYRDVYLKSDDWKTLRRFAMIRQEKRCKLCGHKSKHNDVHHLDYKNLIDVNPSKDLKVLCRKCHEWVHLLMRRYPLMKKLPRKPLWKTIRMHFFREIRYSTGKKNANGLNSKTSSFVELMSANPQINGKI